jgi:hypothetical protein
MDNRLSNIEHIDIVLRQDCRYPRGETRVITSGKCYQLDIAQGARPNYRKAR